MVRGLRWLGMAAGLGLVACQGAQPAAHETAKPWRVPIIGGQRDTVSHGVVGILTQDSLCSGSLLAPNVVLTARHCVASTGGEQIMCGSSRFSPTFDPSSFAVTTDNDLTSNGIAPLYPVSEIRTPSATAVCGNDIAVMILAENIPASVATALIPRLDDRPRVNERFDAVGYGIQNAEDDLGMTAGVRMRANGNAVYCVGESSACDGTDATISEWIAEVPICSGDSGGPALDTEGRVFGVASRSNEDCSAGLYEAVDSWKALIVEATLDAADQGGFEPPEWAGGVPVTDAGPVDSGISGSGPLPDASTSGGSSASSGGTGGDTPGGRAGSAGTSGRDPTGDPCTTSCPNGFVCYAADGDDGVCVPSCSSNDTACPIDYTCNVRLGACEPDDDDDHKRRRNEDEGCGCRTAPVSSRADQAWGILALAGIFAGTLRRRRRATR
jgi:MYXO-CTERM domain-containing protein